MPHTSPVPISIFGSCVSRDTLEFIRPGVIHLETYIARQCISSAIAKPVAIREEDIRLDSRFQRRMVYYDLAKKAFPLLQADKSRFLLLDLIDERFPPVAYQGSTITLSSELVTSGLMGKEPPSSQRHIKRKGLFHKTRRYYVGSHPLEKDIEEFCEKLLQRYSPAEILLHRARLVDFYRDKEDRIIKFPKNYLYFNARTNQLLDFIYDEVEKRLPGCHIIAVSSGFCADETHKWGLSPMHYQKEYYEAAAKRIERIVSGKE